MKILPILIIYFLLIFNITNAQDTIVIVSGKHIFTKEYRIDNNNRELIYKNKRGKEKSIFLDNVYSLIDSSGHESIIYNPENNNQYKYSVIEMKDFVQGGYDASLYFHAPLSTFYGFLAGTSSTIFMQNPLYAIFPSGGICVIVGLPNVSQKMITKKIPQFSENPFYYQGFNQEAKNKRFINSVKGAAAGIFTGLTIIILQLSDKLPEITFN